MSVDTQRPAQTAAPRRLLAPVRHGWWPDAVGVFTWAIMLMVTGLWVANSGIQDLTVSPAEALHSLGRLTGLIASAAMLLQILGMARIPWAERSFGQDRLARWHRLVGFTSFTLMLLHIGLLVAWDSLAGKVWPWDSLWDLVWNWPGMLAAFAGTLCIVMIAVTSVKMARRRLRYESWHLLHLYAYLGAGLALPHQLWTGTDFIASPVATIFWWGLWIAALVSVLIWRVTVPLLRTRRHQLRVASVTTIAPDTVQIVMTGRNLARLRVSAGQFFVWRFRTGAGWTRAHPLSLSAVPTDQSLRVTMGVAGDDGLRIATMQPGTRVNVEGPYGRLVSDVRKHRSMVMFAGGLGIAPLLSLLQENAYSGIPTTLVYRSSTPEHQAHLDDITWLQQNAGLRYVPLTGSRSRIGASWLPASAGGLGGAAAIRGMVPDLADADAFVCGPGPWADAIVADLLAAGLPSSAIHLESFSW